MRFLPSRPLHPQVSRAIFEEGWRRKFGYNNPDPMPFEFWKEMVRWGGDPYYFEDLFQHDSQDKGPIWCFDRMGMTASLIKNHWTVCIGGEHEDAYDPNFMIYNDVILWGPNGEISIFGYPTNVFPPTDFHTATVDGDRIIIIGGLGYDEDREFWRTPIYILHLESLAIHAVEGKGDEPGWIFEHRAFLDAEKIVVSGGKRIDETDGAIPLEGIFELDLRTMSWSRSA